MGQRGNLDDWGEGDGADGKIKRRLVMSWDVWGKEGVSVKVKTSAKKRK